MPPKIKVTDEHIVDAALNIVRTHGPDAINARTIAAALDCSTQPIFSNFATMEELRMAVVEKAYDHYLSYVHQDAASGEYPPYKATGMAYIRFAKEEKELFKLLYMRDRGNTRDRWEDESFNSMASFVQSYTGLSESDASLFHLEMWAYVHGIATMFATGFLDLEWDLVSQMLTDAYSGLKMRYETE